VTRRQFLALILPLFALMVGFVVLWVLEQGGVLGAPRWDSRFSRYVRDRMSQDFVWGLGDDHHQWEAEFRSLNEYVRTFDPYAEVVPPWQVARSREESSGQYGGVGIRTAPPPEEGPIESVEVTGVKPGGPAAKAGVVVGDRIVGAAGRAVADVCPTNDPTPLNELIRGAPDTSVRLRLRAPDGKEREVEVTRARIDTGSVFGARILDAEAGIGYVRLQAFQASTAADCRREITRLQSAGMKALVLDLRHNSGGLMDQAVEVADLFLASGAILRQRGRSAAYTHVYDATAEGTLSVSLPLVVLLDGGSASASEILAGALQDHRRACLVGQRSYGKFLVQMLEEVPMDVGVALFKRTTSIYETPHGHNYQRVGRDDPLAGIRPDLFVPLPKEDRAKLAMRFEDEFYADWNPAYPSTTKDFVDPQLAAAVAVLKGEEVYPPILPAEPAE